MWTHVRNGKCCPFPFIWLKHMIFKSQLYGLQNFWSEYYLWSFVWGNDWNKTQSLQVNSKLYWNLSANHDNIVNAAIITDAVRKNQSLVTFHIHYLKQFSYQPCMYTNPAPFDTGNPQKADIICCPSGVQNITQIIILSQQTKLLRNHWNQCSFKK